MEWKHNCSLAWMQERQKFLTASDVKALLPYTATGRAKRITEEDYLKVYAKKAVQLTEADCISKGAAARGHILEPFAIEEYNANRELSMPGLIHWDDIVIAKGPQNHLAYSPDALDVSISGGKKPTLLGEVKCYSPERHLSVAKMDKMKCEERWQVATAMAVSPTIRAARLILFNPDMKSKTSRLFVKTWDRYELMDEIEKIEEVEKGWLDFIDEIDNGKFRMLNDIEPICVRNAEEIERIIEEEHRFDPSN